MSATGPAEDDVPGLDLARLREHLIGTVGLEVAGPLAARRLLGGQSNLTYLIEAGSDELILRRPPLGHVLQSAHDMTREFRTLSGLHGSPVPVPRPISLCEDAEVVGAPFFLMEFVTGDALRSRADLERYPVKVVRDISEQLVDTLAQLHLIDPVAVGLSDLGRPGGFLRRQVARWVQQFQASRSRDLADADRLIRALEGAALDSQSSAIVHGDYRLDNVLVGPSGTVEAVIDWEMATLGDPLTDLALMLVYQSLDRIDETRDPGVASTPGYLDEEQLLARYARVSGIDISHFGFYLGLANFKLAAIVESIYYRHRAGHGTGDFREGHLVEPLIAAGLAALKEH